MSGNGNSPGKIPGGPGAGLIWRRLLCHRGLYGGPRRIDGTAGPFAGCGLAHGDLCGQCGQPVQRLADGFLAEKPRAALWGSTGGSIRFSAALLRSAFRQSFAGNAAGPVRGHAAVRLHRRRPRDAALGAETQSLSFS